MYLMYTSEYELQTALNPDTLSTLSIQGDCQSLCIRSYV